MPVLRVVWYKIYRFNAKLYHFQSRYGDTIKTSFPFHCISLTLFLHSPWLSYNTKNKIKNFSFTFSRSFFLSFSFLSHEQWERRNIIEFVGKKCASLSLTFFLLCSFDEICTWHSSSSYKAMGNKSPVVVWLWLGKSRNFWHRKI